MLSERVMDVLRDTITVGPGQVLYCRNGDPWGVVVDGVATLLRMKHPDCDIDDLIRESAHLQRMKRARNSKMDKRKTLDSTSEKD